MSRDREPSPETEAAFVRRAPAAWSDEDWTSRLSIARLYFRAYGPEGCRWVMGLASFPAHVIEERIRSWTASADPYEDWSPIYPLPRLFEVDPDNARCLAAWRAQPLDVRTDLVDTCRAVWGEAGAAWLAVHVGVPSGPVLQ